MNEISQIVLSESIGTWLIDKNNSDKAVLVAKLPSTVSKSIRKGCNVELFIGKISSTETYYGIALRVFDTPDAPLLVPMAARTREELSGYKKAALKRKISIQIFDEFSSITLNGTGEMLPCGDDAFNNIDLSNSSIPGNIDTLNKVIDSLCYEIDPSYGTNSFFPCLISKFQIEFELKPLLVISTTPSFTVPYSVDDSNEGETQENQLYQQIKLLTEEGTYLSPQITIGKKERELIDVISITKEFTLFFESKALCVNDTSSHTHYDRKSGKTIKHCKKALTQLEGAIKNYRKGLIIKTEQGDVITPEVDSKQIGIVVISEFTPSSSWDEILQEIDSKGSHNNAFFLVIDLSELMKSIRISFHQKTHLGNILMQRYVAIKENRTLHILSTDSSLPFLPQV